MATDESYYDILGVPRGAAADEIKTGYRQCAIKYHPDRNPGDAQAEARFKQCAEAYEVLSDPDKRRRYDQFGKAGLRGTGVHDWQHVDVHDILSMFGDLFGLGDLFGGFGGGRARSGPRAGASLRCTLDLALEDVAKGVVKTLDVRRQEPCEACQGSGAASGRRGTCKTCGGAGRVQHGGGFFRMVTDCPACGGRGTVVAEPCKVCRGRGFVPKKQTIEIQVPAGIEDGQRIRYAGQGDAGEPGAPRGDLYAEVRLEPHPLFERHGRDLVCQAPISFTQAALGADLEVPTLDGPDRITIAPGTQSGDLFRLAGKGLPDVHGYGRGDILVQVVVEVPKRLSRRQEELLRELAATEEKGVLPHRESFLEKLAKHLRKGNDGGRKSEKNRKKKE